MECNDCGAHYMQTCSWWCGMSESEYKKQHELRYPEKYTLSKVKQLEAEILQLKEMIKSIGDKNA